MCIEGWGLTTLLRAVLPSPTSSRMHRGATCPPLSLSGGGAPGVGRQRKVNPALGAFGPSNPEARRTVDCVKKGSWSRKAEHECSPKRRDWRKALSGTISPTGGVTYPTCFLHIPAHLSSSLAVEAINIWLK